MTFPEFVNQNFGKFNSLREAQAAFTAAGVCGCTETCFGICIACGKAINIFAAQSPDKSRYLTATKAGR